MARVVVSIAYNIMETDPPSLDLFVQRLQRLGAVVVVVPVAPRDLCTCVSQALWLRNLAYQLPSIQEEDLIMISEGDVFVATDRFLEALGDLSYRVWLFWAEPALRDGQTFPMSFTTMRKREWRRVLANSSTCQEALATFRDAAGARTLEDQGVDFGLHWESDQNIVTARLLRCPGSLDTRPQAGPLLRAAHQQPDAPLHGQPDGPPGGGLGQCHLLQGPGLGGVQGRVPG